MGVLLIGDNVRVHQFILTSITDGTRVGGQRIRSLFTPFDARADIILGTDCGRHGGRLKNPRT